MFDKEFHLNNINKIIHEKAGDIFFPILDIKEGDGVIIVENNALPTLLSDAILWDTDNDVVYQFVSTGDSVSLYLKHLAGLA